MPPFEIPESLQAYFTDKKIRSVVDSLASVLDDPSFPDMNREKLMSLNEGVVLACQVRADYVRFMADIWAHTFGFALEGSNLEVTLPENCTIKEVWSERYFWSYVSTDPNLEAHHFELTVNIDDRSNEITLRIWHYDDNDEFVDFAPRLRIPEDWRRVNGEDSIQRIEARTKVTVSELLCNPERGIFTLHSAAVTAVEFVGRRLNPR